MAGRRVADYGLPPQMKEKAENLARASYDNSLDLLWEANYLMEKRRYSRAYALGVLSAEESAKAFLWKAFSVGIITDPKFPKDLRDHNVKLGHLIHIMAVPNLLGKYADEVKAAMEQDKGTTDHSKHVLPELFQRIGKDKEPIFEVIRIFGMASKSKLAGLYVDTEGDHIQRPSEVITSKMAEELLVFLNEALPGFFEILKRKDGRFRMMVDMLDPDLFKGSAWPSYVPRQKKLRLPPHLPNLDKEKISR